MTTYLAASEDASTSARAQPAPVSILRHRRFKSAAASLVTMTFAIYVGWLIIGSLMI